MRFWTKRPPRDRPVIAFFDYPDVFEDFYPPFGVGRQEFGTRWAASGNHAFVALLQREVGDVVWYAFSLEREIVETRHEVVGCRVKFLPSSWLHRRLWRAFYSMGKWRQRQFRSAYTAIASYVSLVSWTFAAALRKDRPDFFFMQDYSTGRFDVLLLVSWMLGIPLLAYHSGSSPDIYVGRLLKRWSIRRARYLIMSGGDELERLARDYGVSRDRMKVIPTPIDIDVFRPMDRGDACRGVNLDPARRFVAYVGRLDRHVKRVSTLIEAFASIATDHPDVDLLIVGDGPGRPSLAMQAEGCAPGRIRFLGWIDDAERLAYVYNAAECLVLTSRSEGFPSVVGEAMACGTPVLASRVGGVSEVVAPERTGWLFEPDDEAALVRHLAFVMTHPDVVRSMRGDVRRTAEARVSPAVVADAVRTCFAWRAQVRAHVLSLMFAVGIQCSC
jgi:glycosyltransferase involved in cell wall biosynthesis